MLDLSESGLKSWFDRLPDDFQASIASEIPSDLEGAVAFGGLIRDAEPSQYLELLNGHAELVEKLGRIGRIRLLSFMCDHVYPFQVKLFHEILGEGEGEEEGSGSSKVGVLFIEDIKAFNEAVAARVYKSSVDSVALKALQEAAFENAAPDSPF